jgi:hypothetical protein
MFSIQEISILKGNKAAILRTPLTYLQNLGVTMFGFDYGTKPRIAVVGDLEFPQRLSDGLVALGYLRIPQFSVLVDPPVLVMAFQDKTIAQECFTHFKGWSDASEDGDAVGIGFVEFEDKEYGLCVYQEPNRLTDRVLPKSYQSETEPLLMNVGYIKRFPQASQGYAWFKTIVKRSPFVLAPGTLNGELMLDLAIRKCEVSFYQQDNIPENTMESVLARPYQSDVEKSLKASPTPNLKLSPLEIFQRRKSQLSRFFPVTLERLRFSSIFSEVKQKLIEEGYQGWQVIQAGCNLVLKYRLPQLFAKTDDGHYDPMGVLDYLINHSEEVSAMLPPDQEISIEQLLKQIKADTYELIRYVVDGELPEISKCELQIMLSEHGLLEASTLSQKVAAEAT